jgi:phage replication O-like protein O
MPKGDRNFLKADTEDGYAKVANLLLEALAMTKMSGVQKGICLYLIRRTYSWGQKEDQISLGEFSAACASSPKYVSRQLNRLIKSRIILRTQNNVGKVPAYTFNTRVDQWGEDYLNSRGLREKMNGGLYKRGSVPSPERTRVYPDQSQEAQGIEASPKERFKENREDDHGDRQKENWCRRYDELFPGELSPFVIDLFQPFVREMTDRVVIEALNRSRSADNPKKYVEAILRDWQSRKVKSIADIERMDKLRQFKAPVKKKKKELTGLPNQLSGKRYESLRELYEI